MEPVFEPHDSARVCDELQRQLDLLLVDDDDFKPESLLALEAAAAREVRKLREQEQAPQRRDAGAEPGEHDDEVEAAH